MHNEIFTQNTDKMKVAVVASPNAKAKLFSVGCIKFKNCYKFFRMSLSNFLKSFGFAGKTLCPYVNCRIGDYKKLVGDLKKIDFKSP